METSNHYALAEYLIQATNRPMLRRYRNAFRFGNISPDLNPFTYLNGHKFESFDLTVKKKLDRLVNKECWTWYDVYELGVVTHYLADYFTYPHNQQYGGSFLAHCRYEKKLHPLFTAYLSRRSGVRMIEAGQIPGKSEVCKRIRSLHQEYVTKRSTYQDDCRYIVSISDCVLRAIAA